MKIKITVNGEARAVQKGLTVTALLDSLGVRRQTAIVELNRKILKKENYDSLAVKEGDELELVRFVGGG